MSHVLQFLASYTFSKILDTDGANINATSADNRLPLGDQNSRRQRWGRTSFDHNDRFAFSTIWMPPGPHGGGAGALLRNWLNKSQQCFRNQWRSDATYRFVHAQPNSESRTGRASLSKYQAHSIHSQFANPETDLSSPTFASSAARP